MLGATKATIAATCLLYACCLVTHAAGTGWPRPSAHTNEQWENGKTCDLVTAEDIANKANNLNVQPLFDKVAARFKYALDKVIYNNNKMDGGGPRIGCTWDRAFWRGSGSAFWDACNEDLPSQAGNLFEGFPSGDVLISPYYDNTGRYETCFLALTSGQVPFLIGDTTRGSDPGNSDFTVYETVLARGKALMDGNRRGSAVVQLEQTVITVWLNYLAGAEPSLHQAGIAGTFNDALNFLSECQSDGQLPPDGDCEDQGGIENAGHLKEPLEKYLEDNRCPANRNKEVCGYQDPSYSTYNGNHNHNGNYDNHHGGGGGWGSGGYQGTGWGAGADYNVGTPGNGYDSGGGSGWGGVPGIRCTWDRAFWRGFGSAFWDACNEDLPSQAGNLAEGFPSGDVLISPYYDNTGRYETCRLATTFGEVPFLIGDTTRGSNPENSEFTVFETVLALGKALVDGNRRGSAVVQLERTVIIVWLNYLAGAEPSLHQAGIAGAFNDALNFLSECQSDGQLPPDGDCEDQGGIENAGDLKEPLEKYLEDNRCPANRNEEVCGYQGPSYSTHNGNHNHNGNYNNHHGGGGGWGGGGY